MSERHEAYNEELMRLAKEATLKRAAHLRAEYEKQAIVSSGEGAPPGMDPAAMGGGAPPGMDPAAMGGGAPPGMDPAAMGAPPADPSAGAAPPPAGPAPITADQMKQILQEVMNGQGGAGGPGGAKKPAKADPILELKGEMYGIKVALLSILNALGLPTPVELVGKDPAKDEDEHKDKDQAPEQPKSSIQPIQPLQPAIQQPAPKTAAARARDLMSSDDFSVGRPLQFNELLTAAGTTMSEHMGSRLRRAARVINEG